MINILMLLPFGVIFIACLLIYRKESTRREHLGLQMHAVKTNRQLKKLLTSIQQHRGMASAFINGDASFRYKIIALQADISRQLTETTQYLKNLPQQKKHFNETLHLWDVLCPSVFSLTKQQSFAQHCNLIVTILNLMRDIAEQNHLHQSSLCSPDVIKILWHLLPDTAEAIGQTRAIGTGIAAAGHSVVTERIKLGFLATRIEESMVRVDQSLDQNPINQGLLERLKPAYLDIRDLLAQLINDVTKQFLESDTPTIDATHFFDQATTILGHVFSVFDFGEQLIHDRLIISLQQNQNVIRIVTAAGTLSMVLGLLLPLWIGGT